MVRKHHIHASTQPDCIIVISLRVTSIKVQHL